MSAQDTAPDWDGTIVINGDLDAILRSLLSERKELQTRVKELEAALNPFAQCCDMREQGIPGLKESGDKVAAFSGLCAPTLGDLRRARALLGGKD